MSSIGNGECVNKLDVFSLNLNKLDKSVQLLNRKRVLSRKTAPKYRGYLKLRQNSRSVVAEAGAYLEGPCACPPPFGDEKNCTNF